MSLSFPYTFTVNGTDFKAKVQKYGYETSYTPVYSETVTTMDKVDHAVIVRWRHGLKLTLNPQSESDLKTFCTALSSAVVPVIVFSSLQLESDVSANMQLSPESAALVLKNSTRRVIGPIELTFTEL